MGALPQERYGYRSEVEPAGISPDRGANEAVGIVPANRVVPRKTPSR